MWCRVALSLEVELLVSCTFSMPTPVLFLAGTIRLPTCF